MGFQFTPTDIPEVVLISYPLFGDERGFFSETFRAEVFEEQGLPPLVQENHSRSTGQVLRGLHYQKKDAALGKLVRCPRGKIFDVAVDLRKNSPTYARWVGVELGEEMGLMLWIPPGFAHGFCVMSEAADVLYRQSGYYNPDLERSVRWNDPEIGIQWPLHDPILSAKDGEAPLLRDSDNDFVYSK